MKHILLGQICITKNVSSNPAQVRCTQYNIIWLDYDVHFVLDQHAELDIYSASSLKEQSADRHVAPLAHIILIPSQPVY